MVLHGILASNVDSVATKIAEIEHIPLVATNMPLKELILSLQSHDMKH
jgi:predicted transcriptional regulator